MQSESESENQSVHGRDNYVNSVAFSKLDKL